MKTQHYKKPFIERSRYTTQPAEEQFEAWAPTQGVSYFRYGLDRPDFNYVPQMPSVLRTTPDFVAEAQGERFDAIRDEQMRMVRHFLVECKGCGADQTIKVREDSFEHLQAWQAFLGRPVSFFLYDMVGNRISPLNPLELVLMKAAKAETGTFPDNHKTFYKLTTDMFQWEDSCVT